MPNRILTKRAFGVSIDQRLNIPTLISAAHRFGTYVATSRNNTPVNADGGVDGDQSSYASVKTEMSSNAHIAGIKCRWYWTDFENAVKATSDAGYDFSDVGLKLTDCAARGKNLMVLIATSMGSGIGPSEPNIVPKYMITGSSSGNGSDGVAYQGGQWGYNSSTGAAGGYRIRLANANVRARFNAMLRALARYLQAHPIFANFEHVAFTETAVGSVASGYTLPDEQATFDGILSAADALRDEMPSRNVAIAVNFETKKSAGQPGIPYLIAAMQTRGLVFNSPDTFKDKSDLWAAPNGSGLFGGALKYMQTYTGARSVECQDQDYKWTDLPLGNVDGHKPAFQADIYDVAYPSADPQSLDCNYVIWTRAAGSGNTNPDTGNFYYEDMYTFLNTKSALPGCGANMSEPTNWPKY